LASLKKKSIYRELNCFLRVEDNILEEEDLVDEATRDIFALSWEAVTLPAEEVLSCF